MSGQSTDGTERSDASSRSKQSRDTKEDDDEYHNDGDCDGFVVHNEGFDSNSDKLSSKSGRYIVGNALDELRQLDSESAAVVVLDDAWARPGRQGAFGVEYPTHDLQVSYEILEVSWDLLAPGGWLICDADDWLAPRLESHIREEYGDVTAYGDYQGGGYRRRGGVTYVDVSGEPDQSTPGQYLSNGGYPVVFAHKGPTDRRTTASARQIARHPRRVENGYPYGRGSVKPIEPYRRWIEGLTGPGETIVEPCAGTAPASIAAASLGRECIAIDIEEDAREAHCRRKSAYLQSEQTTLVAATDGRNNCCVQPGTDRSDKPSTE